MTAVVPRLSEGICHKTWWAGRRAPGSWPDAAKIGLPPRFLNHFPAWLFPFCSLYLELLIFFFFHQLPCFGSWQTKLVSPLIRKAGFFRRVEASMQ